MYRLTKAVSLSRYHQIITEWHMQVSYVGCTWHVMYTPVTRVYKTSSWIHNVLIPSTRVLSILSIRVHTRCTGTCAQVHFVLLLTVVLLWIYISFLVSPRYPLLVPINSQPIKLEVQSVANHKQHQVDYHENNNNNSASQTNRIT